ncbi:MAG TPA: hypothetical protein VMR28_03720 [Candidatus Saccharimonadales bacterium]|nr:hypothetical protein [Candidatus Saccharimonadales bacterium]
MTSAVALALIVILPIALIVVLRVNASLVFLSLCLGSVLNQFVTTDTNSLTRLLSSSHATATLHPANSTWRLILLLFPVVVTTALMAYTIKGKSRKTLNILPAIGVGLVGALLVVPLLPTTAANNIINNTLWTQLTNYQGLVVGLSALACLSMLWFHRPKTSGGKHKKHDS